MIGEPDPVGSFYTNIAIKGANRDQVVEAVMRMRRSAYVSPEGKGIVVVYDAKCERQDTKDLCDLSVRLSKSLRCTAWGVLNHDDDVLWYVLCSNGEYIDEYNSAPDYFDEDSDGEIAAPSGGNAKVLAQAFKMQKSVRTLEKILRRSDADDNAYTFATERHQAVAKALGLPRDLVSIGYDYISAGELPSGMRRSDFVHVGKLR